MQADGKRLRRPAFVQVLGSERLIPLEPIVGRPANRRATGLPPLFSGRPELPTFLFFHDRSPTYRSTPTAAV